MMEAVDQADVDDDANTSELVRLYFHVDPRTNVAFLTGPDESVVESYAYDPYGNVTIRDEAGDSVAASPVGNPFTFQRRRLDAETGLYYFRARHYDPVAGQWMQRDPLGLIDGPNAHEFAGSNPTSRLDPRGLFQETALREIVATAGRLGVPIGPGCGGLPPRAVVTPTEVVLRVGVSAIAGTAGAALELRSALESVTESQVPTVDTRLCGCVLRMIKIAREGKQAGKALTKRKPPVPVTQCTPNCRTICENWAMDKDAEAAESAREIGRMTGGKIAYQNVLVYLAMECDGRTQVLFDSSSN